jgi:SpoVK/Ycf46/Vps4 family AAA+-type ATPase
MTANRLPHLICSLSIDEIDLLVPKRDNHSSDEDRVSKINVLLSVIGGIKNVLNLMLFSATNRLHMIDKPFLQRMSSKFFVGRLSVQARRNSRDFGHSKNEFEWCSDEVSD